MNADELRTAYSTLRRERAARSTAEQPNAEVIRQALDGELSADARERVLEQAIASGASARLALLQAAHVASSGAFLKTSAHTRPSRQWWPLAAAAVLVLAVGVPLATRAPQNNATFRASSPSNAPRLIAPASGAVLQAGQRFVWSTVPGSTGYTLELLDANGRVVTQLATTDTVAVLSASVTAADRARTTGWWATAIAADGRQTRSELRLTRAR